MANGFPGLLLKNSEAFVSTDILQMMNIEVGGPINIKYDLLSFLPESDANLEEIIFDYKRTDYNSPTKGEKFLDAIGYDTEMTMMELYDEIGQYYGENAQKISSTAG